MSPNTDLWSPFIGTYNFRHQSSYAIGSGPWRSERGHVVVSNAGDVTVGFDVVPGSWSRGTEDDNGLLPGSVIFISSDKSIALVFHPPNTSFEQLALSDEIGTQALRDCLRIGDHTHVWPQPVMIGMTGLPGQPVNVIAWKSRSVLQSVKATVGL